MADAAAVSSAAAPPAADTPREQPLQWATTAVGLFAIVSYALFRREQLYTGITALLLFAPHAFPLRFRRRSFLLLLFRLLMYGHALLAGIYAPPAAHSLTPLGDYVQSFTRLCMAEMAVQPWISSIGLSRMRRDAAVILLSCITFSEASKTIDVAGTFPYLFALPFFLLMAAALKNLRERSHETAPLLAVRSWIHVVLLAVALGVGLSTSFIVRANKSSLNPFQLAGITAPAATAAATVSFTTAPLLGSHLNVGRSMQRVLRVSGSMPRGGYLRGMSFHTYMLRHWDPPGESRAFASVAPQQAEIPAASQRTEITRLVDDIPYLFLPLNTRSIHTDAADLRRQVGIGGGDAYQSYDAPPFTVTAATSEDAFTNGPLSAAPDDGQRKRLLVVPNEIDPGVVRLARNLTSRFKEPMQRVRAIEDHLRKEHGYSLEARLSDGDPISDFVLNKRNGHCELFASAATMMLRASGVPTRYVTGFFVHESSGGNTWIVRQQDAHAWAESFIDGIGWVTVDGTPESGLPFQLGEAPSIWRGIGETVGDWVNAVMQYVKKWRAFEWAMAGLIVALIMAYISWRRWKARQRRRIKHVDAYEIPDKRLADLAIRFEQRLLALSTPCPPQMTWQEHLSELLSRSELPANRAELENAAAFAKAYAEVRFGKPTDAKAVERLAQSKK